MYDNCMTDGKQQLHRITVNLIPRASAALELAAQLGQDSKTDTINRALQMYAYFMQVKSEGDEILIRHPDGETEKITFF